MKAFSILMVALGLTASALINIEVLLIQLAFIALFYIYSAEPIRLKRIFTMKQVTVAVGGAIACLSAGLAAGEPITLTSATHFWCSSTAGLF